MPTWFDQSGSELRFDWGLDGLRNLAPHSDVVVVVDVLRFTTAVDVALGRGAIVYPYRWYDGSEVAYAVEREAVVAERVMSTAPGPPWSLSPSSLSHLPNGQAIVLPSPNGSTLSFEALEAGAGSVFAGCLRNATAVGTAALSLARRGGGVVSVVAAGERWRSPGGPLRPAFEDLVGAGAILSAAAQIGGSSVEAAAAIAAFESTRDDLAGAIERSGSGRELSERGMAADLEWAVALDASDLAPRLDGGRFVDG